MAALKIESTAAELVHVSRVAPLLWCGLAAVATAPVTAHAKTAAAQGPVGGAVTSAPARIASDTASQSAPFSVAANV